MVFDSAFITGTFDQLHHDHIRMLQSIKKLAKVLIFGLVTDELAVRQKRRTLHTFSHRKELLLLIADVVVPHDGEPQYDHVKRLRPSAVFTTTEYFGSPEFDALRAACNVTIVCVPRGQTVSSTEVIGRMHADFIRASYLICMGVGGPILGFPGRKVVKYSKICESERGAGDVFGFYQGPDAAPRNWKGGHNPMTGTRQSAAVPNVAGYPVREAVVMSALANYTWCPYVSHEIVTTSNATPFRGIRGPDAGAIGLAKHANNSRSRSGTQVVLTMKFAGVTLSEWVTGQPEYRIRAVIDSVRQILLELGQAGVVHGDAHPGNVLVDVDSSEVSIVDFQWSQTLAMCGTDQERHDLSLKLQSNFDLVHFKQSCEEYVRIHEVLCADKNWLY